MNRDWLFFLIFRDKVNAKSCVVLHKVQFVGGIMKDEIGSKVTGCFATFFVRWWMRSLMISSQAMAGNWYRGNFIPNPMCLTDAAAILKRSDRTPKSFTRQIAFYQHFIAPTIVRVQFFVSHFFLFHLLNPTIFFSFFFRNPISSSVSLVFFLFTRNWHVMSAAASR